MVIIYLLILALVLGLLIAFLGFILENLVAVFITVIVLGLLIYGISSVRKKISHKRAVQQARDHDLMIRTEIEKHSDFKSKE